ncbi:unnamed protein product [Callosobruchus maculatus]|uniref:THAP-type domain-containing protein n=1 Tax=Callosobruchus maculatus TaxID=64391 RepID=A0A653DA84_CALMS|nr:unnamed protein product [Callosobruchus maculatus]
MRCEIALFRADGNYHSSILWFSEHFQRFWKMVESCCAVNCCNRRTKGVKMKFHRLPIDPYLRNLWLHAIGRIHFTPSRTTVICEEHFTSQDYEVNVHGNRVLKRSAVPSKFHLSQQRCFKWKHEDSTPEEAAFNMENTCYCDDLYSAYQSRKLTDLTLKCEPDADDDSQIEVHRLVLGCASEEILEKISARDSNAILHLPYTVTTMKILVELAYGRQVTIQPHMIPQLQEAMVALKMKERIRSYIDQYARYVANSPQLLEDNNDNQGDSHKLEMTDGDVTPELFFTPEDGRTSPERRMTSSPLQRTENTRVADSQMQPSDTQASLMLVEAQISVVVVDSSSDDELVESGRKSNKTNRQRPQKKLPIKTERCSERDDTQTQSGLSKKSSQREERISCLSKKSSQRERISCLSKKSSQREERISFQSKRSSQRQERISSLSKKSSQREERIASTENLRSSSSDSSDESTTRSPKLPKMEVEIASSTVSSSTQEEVNAEQTQESESSIEENSSVPVSTSPRRKRNDDEEISNTSTGDQRNVVSSASSSSAQQGAKRKVAWCTKAVSDIPPLHGDPGYAELERKMLNSMLVDVEEPPSRKELKRMARLIQISEFKRLDNLCMSCLKFQDDIKGHQKSCSMSLREPRRKFVKCDECGTPFAHASILRYHICKDKLSGNDCDL